MDERRMQFWVGVMVVATLLVTAILVLLFRRGPVALTRGVTVCIDFPDAMGVNADTPIKKSGILIGRVQKVVPLAEGVSRVRPEGGARVTAQVEAGVIHENERCVIKSTLWGDSTIHFVPSGRKDLPRTTVDPRAPDDKGGEENPIRGETDVDPIQVVTDLQERLSGAINSVARTSDELGQVVRQVGDLLNTNGQTINRIIRQTDETTVLLRDTARDFKESFGDPDTRARIKDSLQDLPALIHDSRQTMVQISSMMSSFDKNLHNLEKFTGSLGDQGAQTIDQLGHSAKKLDELMEQLVYLTREMNRTDGSLGKLIHDPELYDNLNRTVRNAEELSRRLRPIVEDVRVFTDQIARHPEKLGVRGAIEKSDGTKW